MLTPQVFYPTPQSPPRLRGGEVLRQQSRGGVTLFVIGKRLNSLITYWQGFRVKLTRMGVTPPLRVAGLVS